jgi:hypothetical protein
VAAAEEAAGYPDKADAVLKTGRAALSWIVIVSAVTFSIVAAIGRVRNSGTPSP